ncbi:MAG: TonB-dependent receptor [Endomicrobiia bacterium]
MKKITIILFSLFLYLNIYSLEKLKETEIELVEEIKESEIYITTVKKGVSKKISLIPLNVTVITNEDIQKSKAKTVGELLRYQTGIIVRDLYYSSPYENIDIRGFGESSAQNCVILLDGKRLNNIDMSNVDINIIPISAIEKIEIIKGGISTLYGDGAVGGVVNIITKKLPVKSTDLNFSYNSFEANDVNLNISDYTEKLFYRISSSYKNNRGYRKNSNFSSSNIDINLSFPKEILKNLDTNINFGVYSNNINFPGGIFQTDWDENKIDKTYTPDDKGNKFDYYLNTSLKNTFGKIELETSILYKNSDVKNSFVSWWPNGYYDNRKSEILGVEEKLFSKIKENGELLLGLEYYYNFYKIIPLTNTGELTPQSDDQKYTRNSLASYLDFSFPVFSLLTLNIGGRVEYFTQKFFIESSNSEENKDETLNGVYFAANIPVSKRLNFYTKLGKSYRMPKVDEYYSWGLYNEQLKPQISEDIDLGLKFDIKNLNFNISVFNTKIEKEIYYNNTSWLNENYPSTTLRQGVDTSLKLNIKDIDISLGHTFTDAKFENGPYKDKKVPLVPQNKYNFSVSFNLPFKINIKLINTTVDERYFGSDYLQTTNKLKGYSVTDIKISYNNINNLELYLLANNITNEKYSEIAYLGYYYPSALRNFVLGVNLKF